MILRSRVTISSLFGVGLQETLAGGVHVSGCQGWIGAKVPLFHQRDRAGLGHAEAVDLELRLEVDLPHQLEARSAAISWL
jgi:hypothetical protein